MSEKDVCSYLASITLTDVLAVRCVVTLLLCVANRRACAARRLA